jgi:hypothetical protein
MPMLAPIGRVRARRSIGALSICGSFQRPRIKVKPASHFSRIAGYGGRSVSGTPVVRDNYVLERVRRPTKLPSITNEKRTAWLGWHESHVTIVRAQQDPGERIGGGLIDSTERDLGYGAGSS